MEIVKYEFKGPENDHHGNNSGCALSSGCSGCFIGLIIVVFLIIFGVLYLVFGIFDFIIDLLLSLFN